MKNKKIKKELEEYIDENVANYKEYQNKYFLKKKIKELLPHKSDDFIYRAIENVNSKIKTSKKKEYIVLLLDELGKYNLDCYQL